MGHRLSQVVWVVNEVFWMKITVPANTKSQQHEENTSIHVQQSRDSSMATAALAQKVPLLLLLHIFMRNELFIEGGKGGVLFLFCLEICLAQIHKGTSCAQ